MPIDTDVYTYELGQDEIDSADEVTLGQFRALAKRWGWSEEWLVEQCRDHMDNPRAIVQEILDGYGLTKPQLMGSHERPHRVNLKDTVLVWRPLLNLYHTRNDRCCCGCEQPLQGKQRYATPTCRKRVSRLRDQPGTSSWPA